MCGIAGVFSSELLDKLAEENIRAMNNILRHRGPDDEGLSIHEKCILGHRRLSIIDLSKDGHQPFISEDNRYQIIFNGEIYNYIELREELKQQGWKFRTASDTEVLLSCYIRYGTSCLNKFNGMFAFAVYDTREHTLFLGRDRFGVKPLYYTILENKIYFASEIKALRLIRNTHSVNQLSLFDFLCFNRTDVYDETFLNEIKRIPKGHYGFISSNGVLNIKQWWNAESFLSASASYSNINEVYQKIDELIASAVALRMRSDVTVGSTLSGGLDSSIIVGILSNKNLLGANYKTFTASFPGLALDETRYVDELKKKYPFKNYRTFPEPGKLFDEFDKFTFSMDEPCPGPSGYSQYKVMEIAKQNGVTVLLDGQGGDESFAGYQYFHAFYQTSLLRQLRLPAFFEELFFSLIRKQERESFETLVFQNIPRFLKKELLFQTLDNIIHRDFFYEHVGQSRIFNYFFNATDLNTSLVRHFQYKLEHLLRFEDRNSMAFSIEARLPYLDYRFVEYALSIPENLKIARGENKILQKKSLGKYTISSILERRDKIGFGTPGEAWMQMPKWKERTNDNYSYLANKFPEIFKAKSKLKNNLYERWKINQLAVWHRQVS